MWKQSRPFVDVNASEGRSAKRARGIIAAPALPFSLYLSLFCYCSRRELIDSACQRGSGLSGAARDTLVAVSRWERPIWLASLYCIYIYMDAARVGTRASLYDT